MFNLFQHFRAGLWLGISVLSGACFLAGRFSASTSPVPAGSIQHVAAVKPAGPGPDMAAPVIIVQTNYVSVDAPVWDEADWNRWHSQPGTLARNTALAALLEKLAASDPQRAMALAQAENNLKLRDMLVQAVLHGWARTAPQDAANWANALTDPSARETAMDSVFAGAVAGSPEEAVRIGNLLIRQNPGEAVGYGSRLIDALCAAGDFAAASQLATGGDAGVQRSIWLAEAYSKWAELQPEQAAQAANALADPVARNEALHGIVGGWAEADPAGLAQYLSQQPPDTERGQMIGQALENWARLDPVAAANWMNTHAGDLGGDMDKGLQSVATMSGLQPDIAVAWAENITDEKLRSEALDDVLRNWVHSDPQAATTYFNTTQNLLPADRQQIAEILTDLNSQAMSQAQ